VNSTGILLDPMQVATLVVIPFMVGALSSWMVAHLYYKKAKLDAINQRWAARLDWLEVIYKGILVAVYNYGKPIPLYAELWCDGTARGGEGLAGTFSSPYLFNLIDSHTPHCLLAIYFSDRPAQDATFILTDYGKDCAKYLKEQEIEAAQIFEIKCDPSLSMELFKQYGSVHGVSTELDSTLNPSFLYNPKS
jgi:hypothetical protein